MIILRRAQIGQNVYLRNTRIKIVAMVVIRLVGASSRSTQHMLEIAPYERD